MHYEISNWAKDVKNQPFDPGSLTPSYACRHNLQYWHSRPYLAFGAGAHGYAKGYRYSNALRIKTYIERIIHPTSFISLPFPFSPAAVNQHKQTLQDDISEYMLNNLRLTNTGAVESDFRTRFGCGLLDAYPKEIEELIQLGLLESKTSRVLGTREVSFRLTKRGRLLGNQVFMRFLE